jgi:hypothetical protein
MAGDNHHVHPVELALLSSTPAKAPAGPRCGDCCRTETPQWMAGPMGPSMLCADCGFVASMLGSGGIAFSPDLSNHDSRLTVPTRSWCVVGGVPERPSWSHVAAVALHLAIDVKCTRRVDYHGEPRRTTVPVPAPRASSVNSHSTIDVVHPPLRLSQRAQVHGHTHHHKKLACSGWNAREVRLVAHGSRGCPLRY